MKPTRTMLIACLTFLALGLVTAAPGPALPELAERTNSSLTAVGGLYTAIFLGALFSILAAGALSDRFGQVPVLLAGALLTGLGTLAYTFTGSLPAMLALAFMTGMGHGAVDIATNVLIARAYAGRSITALNVLNLFFGVGAMAGPAVAAVTMGMGQTGLSGLWLGGGLMLTAALLVPLLPRLSAGESETPQPAAASGRLVLRSAMAWATGLMLLLYVGVENGLAGWATTYLTETTTLDSARAAWVTSGFWMALTVGRLAAAALGTRLAPGSLLRLFLTVSVAGGALLVLSTGSAWLSVASVLLLGFSFGPVFPTAVGIITNAFPQAPGTASSLVIAMGSMGGMLLPLLQGAVLEGAGPRASMGLVTAGTLGMLLLLGLALRLGAQPEAAKD